MEHNNLTEVILVYFSPKNLVLEQMDNLGPIWPKIT